jgi:hypothetical protein
MKKEKIIISIVSLFIIGLVLGACSGASTPAAPTATIAVKAPTTISQPTVTPTPLIPTLTPTPALPAMKEYKHPSNSFSISVPADWTIAENSGYVFLSSPDQKAFVEIFAENTGNALNADTFTNTINAFEFNALSHLKNYNEAKRDIQTDSGYAIIAKSLDINAVPFVAVTKYEQKGKVLFIENFYLEASIAEANGPLIKAIMDSFKSNPAYAEDLAPFTSAIFDFIDPDNLYSLIIPSLWTKNDVNKDGNVITYSSPDNNAFIMLVKVDLGKKVIRTLADSTTLEFLKNISTNKDTRVSKMEILKNGSIQMTWSPKSGGLQGLSIYKWSGTTWFILTWMANTGFEALYGPVFNQSIGSYQIPE